MRASLVFLLFIATGCSLTNPTDDLIFRSVPTTSEALPDSVLVPFGIFLKLVRTEPTAEALREETGLGRDAIPDVDWSTETLFVVSERLLPSERLVIESVRIKRGSIRAMQVQGVILRQPGLESDRRSVLTAVAIQNLPSPFGQLEYGARVEDVGGR